MQSSSVNAKSFARTAADPDVQRRGLAPRAGRDVNDPVVGRERRGQVALVDNDDLERVVIAREHAGDAPRIDRARSRVAIIDRQPRPAPARASRSKR